MSNILSEFELFFKGVNEYKDKELTLSRIDNAIQSISFAENQIGKVIHLAGSNGKGSTSYFIAQLLQHQGYKVTLFTSPHILKINERIRVNDVDITDAELNRIFNEYKSIITKFSLTYFEAIFFIALIYFKDNRPDYTILETGLGGRFDATNTSAINKKIAVITKIAQDHIDVFGKNIFNITYEKIGIVRKDSPLFVATNSEKIISYIKQELPEHRVHLTEKNDYADKKYQYPYNENYQTAKNVVEYTINKNISDKELKLPVGRYEVHNKLIFDSTHNISGLLAVKKSNIINEIDVIIFTQTKERNIDKFISVLKTICDKLILTTLPNSNRSITLNDINIDGVINIENPLEALNYAKEISDKKILIIGSFYLISFYKSSLQVDDL